MLTEYQNLAVQLLAEMGEAMWELTLKRGFVTVDLDPARYSSDSGIWTPVNLTSEILLAATYAATHHRCIGPAPLT